MKRRVFTLLAVPALALGFTVSSAGTDEADAYYPYLGDLTCLSYAIQYTQADNADDYANMDYYWEALVNGRCFGNGWGQ